ncbi:MurR/RpiR family transcriptional regulator [Clostridium sediminicola]|uniref:MurR/RpiR family transcriptional regulator n=1 Tax=Clostridium sediminicola TaxID=3114879 RepID=UPI0031F27DF6
MSLLVQIQKKYNAFTEKEKSIATYILNKNGQIQNTSIIDLAKKTNTSGATITRFCKKIGCSSYVDMKIKLHITNSKEPSTDAHTVFSDVYTYYSEVIERTKQLIDKALIYELVEVIKSARNIYIYGIGSSGLSAIEMMQRLLRMGFNVHAISDTHMMIINSAIVSEKDLVIGISVSGETEDVIHALKTSKNHGAKTVAITSFEDSSITKFADTTLIIYNSSFVERTRFINSQFSTMYLLDLICTLLLKDNILNDNYQITIDAIINN